MSGHPTCVVWMVTFNHASFIRHAIESVLMQETNFSFRLLIGDDHSTDGTTEICRSYVEKFPGKVELFTHDDNKGATANGIRMYKTCFASGAKYIAMCEGDDYWTDPGKLQKQIDILDANPEFVMCHHWQKITEKNAQGMYEEHSWPREPVNGYLPQRVAGAAELFTFQLRPQTRTMVFRNIFTEISLPDWFYSVRFGDQAFCFLLSKYGKFWFLEDEMAVYRVTTTGVSSIFRDKKGFITGNKAWLETWANASRYHNFKFVDEALRGMTIFLSRIRKFTGNSYIQRIRLIGFIFRLDILPVMKRRLITGLLKKEKNN